jgi:hypothetical protein
MLASRHALEIAVLCSLVAGGGKALANEDEELPDIEFLEYLGSWEESDEDWLLFNEVNSEPAAGDEQETNDPENVAKESTESD